MKTIDEPRMVASSVKRAARGESGTVAGTVGTCTKPDRRDQYSATGGIGAGSEVPPAPFADDSGMGTTHTVSTILPTIMAGLVMVWVGLSKRRLERRPQECRNCHRRSCTCSSRH
jgi:hypothetical protein